MNMNEDALPPVDAPVVSDDELHALLDGRCSPQQRAQLEQRVAIEPEAAARLQRWHAQRALLQGLHAPVLQEPVPAAMRDTLQRAGARRQAAGRWWRWGGMAASVVVAFGLGWLLRGTWPGASGSGDMARLEADFVRQAAVAHAVYTPEQRHPVEVGAGEQAHLAQWLSKRLGKPLRPPVLSSHGFDLLGGRLLPGLEGARAQFMYQHANGTRLTLYVGVVSAGPAGSETAFRFTDQGPVPGFYWVDQGLGYALSAALPRATLAELATTVHGQL